jgi:hypothetical protein
VSRCLITNNKWPCPGRQRSAMRRNQIVAAWFLCYLYRTVSPRMHAYILEGVGHYHTKGGLLGCLYL